MDSVIEQICEDFSESHYVYLVRPHSEARNDSAAGVRFLSHSLDCLPAFGSVDTAIAVGDPALADRLKAHYPDSKLALWDPSETVELPEQILSLLRPTVIRGDFGGSDNDQDFAQAI